MADKLLATLLQKELHYDPATGIFTRKTKRGGCPIGSKAGHTTKAGYVELNVAGTRIHAHRAAWLYVHGDMPKGEIDHINRIRSDNRLSNLRDVDHSTNALNVPMRKHNTSGHTGVYWHKPSNGWLVMLQRKRVSHYLGYFKEKEQAIRARDKWLQNQ
jgi:hypothetical protein